MKSKKETETQVSMNEMGEKREEYRRKGGKKERGGIQRESKWNGKSLAQGLCYGRYRTALFEPTVGEGNLGQRMRSKLIYVVISLGSQLS